jgi:hypothetical protein
MSIAGATAFIAMVYAGSPSPQAEPAGAEISPFGSWAAQENYFDRDHSDFKPALWLTKPGTLKGQWLAPGRKSVLQIDPDSSRREDEGDVFVMQAGTAKWPFESSYGGFAVFGCDIDGDQMDEVVIEDGMGRGTCVYRRRLTILKLFGDTWHRVHSDWLSGYLPNDQGDDPLAWQRRYGFVSLRSGGFDVLLRLDAPERVPMFLYAPEDYAVLQHTRYVMRYQPGVKAFRIWDETFVRPPVTGGQHSLGTNATASAGDTRKVPPRVDLPLPSFPCSFSCAPFVHPNIIQDLTTWLSDTGDQVVAINLLDAQESNRYSGDVHVRATGGSFPYVYVKKEDGEFAYRYVGTTESGIHVVETSDRGSGSGMFNSLLLLTIELDSGISVTLDDQKVLPDCQRAVKTSQ